MGFSITHRMGEQESDPPLDRLSALISELDAVDDKEHPDVIVKHESEWALSAFPGGLVVWENVEAVGSNARHLSGLTRERVLELARAVAVGDLGRVEQEPWRPGFG